MIEAASLRRMQMPSASLECAAAFMHLKTPITPAANDVGTKMRPSGETERAAAQV